MQHTQPELHEAQQARASASQRKAKLGAVEAVLWNKRLGSGKQWRLKGVFKRHFAFQIVRCLDVRLKEISLNITVDRGLRLGPESPGITPKAASSKSLSGQNYQGAEVLYQHQDWRLCLVLLHLKDAARECSFTEGCSSLQLVSPQHSKDLHPGPAITRNELKYPM